MIAIVSGGMDSVTALYQYKDDASMVLSFDYGSKHNGRELFFAGYHAECLGKRHLIIKLDFMKNFRSALIDDNEKIPDGHYQDEVMKRTVVPFRNGVMLSIAAGVAENEGVDRVMIGNHAGDHAIYPDCRKDFIESMSNAIRFGTYSSVEIFSPYCDITKREIAMVGVCVGVDYVKTWSCYNGRDIHCGTCGTCIERKEALFGFDATVYSQ